MVYIRQLSDEFSSFEPNRDLIRFNLYKTCLVSLQHNFIKVHRLRNLYWDVASDDLPLAESFAVALTMFKMYCGNVMDQRKKEVLADRRMIDTTTWPLDDTEQLEEVNIDQL